MITTATKTQIITTITLVIQVIQQGSNFLLDKRHVQGGWMDKEKTWLFGNFCFQLVQHYLKFRCFHPLFGDLKLFRQQQGETQDLKNIQSKYFIQTNSKSRSTLKSREPSNGKQWSKFKVLADRPPVAPVAQGKADCIYAKFPSDFFSFKHISIEL